MSAAQDLQRLVEKEMSRLKTSDAVHHLSSKCKLLRQLGREGFHALCKRITELFMDSGFFDGSSRHVQIAVISSASIP